MNRYSEFYTTRNDAEYICRIVEHYMTVIKDQKGDILLDKVEERIKEIYEAGKLKGATAVINTFHI